MPQWNQPDTFDGYHLPTGAQFSKQKLSLDPSIFDTHEQMHPYLRDWVLGIIDDFWLPRYGQWRTWARVYLAGSSASYWWQGDNDFDILIGVDNLKMVKAARNIPSEPERNARLLGLAQLPQKDLCKVFNDEFKELLDPQLIEVEIPGEDGLYEMTCYANPYSYDIRNIRPYAAYCLSEAEWYVHPAKMPKDWSAKYLAEPFWAEVGTMAERIESVLALPEPERTEKAKEIFEALHQGRKDAYSSSGSGVYDHRQVLWLVLEREGVLQKLLQAVDPSKAVHPAPAIP